MTQKVNQKVTQKTLARATRRAIYQGKGLTVARVGIPELARRRAIYWRKGLTVARVGVPELKTFVEKTRHFEFLKTLLARFARAGKGK